MDEHALRQAIIDHPQDDAPRLAYAAWCDAQADQAHGNYIRAAVAWAKTDRHSPEAEKLFQEEMSALQARPKNSNWHAHFDAAEARYKTAAGITHSSLYYETSRGFTAGIGGKLPAVIAILKELCTVEPIEQLGILWDGGNGERESPQDAQNLAAMPLLSRIRNLFAEPNIELIRALGHSPRLKNLEKFGTARAESEARPLDVEAFLTELLDGLAHSFSGVTQLQITGVPLGPHGVERLCASPAATKWQRLVLERAGLGDDGAKRLASATSLHNVQDLWLRQNGITAEGLTALADAPGLAQVRDLDLGFNTIDDAGMKALAQRKSMPNLRRLGLQESVHEIVYTEWTDWTGPMGVGGNDLRVMEPKDIAVKYPLPGVTLYKLRHE